MDGTFDKNLLKNDLLFNMLIIGNPAVGKSCLLSRYADNKFSEKYWCTYGFDIKTRTIEMDNKIIKLSMLDTAGRKRYRTTPFSLYRRSHGVMIVFDVTDMKSFQKVHSWISEINDHDGEHVAKLLVGNKADLTNKRVVTFEMAQEFANEMGMPYVETSAETASNVEPAFLTLTAEIKKKYDSGMFQKIVPTVKLANGRNVKDDIIPL